MNLEKMKVAELREELEKRGLDTKGTKPFLVSRLQEALISEGGSVGGGDSDSNMESGDMETDMDMENGADEEEAENGVQENGQEIKSESITEVKSEPKTETKPEIKTEKESKAGVKRKFGEVSPSIEEMKPWVIREDEPELKEDFVCLDWFNSDLNLRIRHDDFLSAMPLNKESWSWIYAGCRATHGVTNAKVMYEVKIEELMRVYTEKDGAHHDLRVGWSTNTATRQLGEDCMSWAYSSAEGKKAHNTLFEEFGAKAEKNDVIAACLDMSGQNVVMTFTKNGETLGEAFSFPKSQLQGEALFPHILSRNVKFSVVFGKDKDEKEKDPLHPAMEGYTQIGKLDTAQLVRGSPGIKTREECEFIMMVGLPAAGKSTWARQYAQAHPDKKYEILNANEFLDRATVWGESRKKHTNEITWEKVHHRVTKAIQEVVKVASRRRRNIILDQAQENLSLYDGTKFVVLTTL